MSETALIGTYVLSILVLIANICTVIVAVSLIVKKETALVRFVRVYALGLMLVVALTSFFGSTFYSVIVGYEPCVLCVWQRFFMFPLPFILLFAFLRKDRAVVPYVALLSIIGFGIALFHYYGQMISPSSLPCDATEVASACAYLPFVTFGFITIPYMALSGFIALIVIAGTVYVRSDIKK